MKLGLFGYGKMGKAIEQIAENQGLEIVWRMRHDDTPTPALLRQADVAIEFTRPEAAFDNVMLCLQAGLPVVSGTTGWLDRLPEAQKFCLENGGAMLWASNFSVGVNLFFALNRRLAELMAARPEYAVSLTETHHIHKLDAPSGTALTLAREMIEKVDRYKGWSLVPDTLASGEVPIIAIREGEVPGTHLVRWHSGVDEISIEHKAHSRAGFAAGAVLAAQWIADKRGVFEMGDVLGL
ncbi:MAG: 4-hydroxy-tetrahydrodipicolinate reductase [Saprospiraceae bacterium]|nr:4-hydroxy-tetrahydrodipicolinate reductase [Saprospiraceae bacterium]